AAGLDTVALLGTGYTMRDPFYRDHMAARGITTVAPEEPDLTALHNLIYDHLAAGDIPATARQQVLDTFAATRERGAAGLIAGCTEIPLVATQDDVDVPYF